VLRTLIDEASILERVRALGARIDADYAGERVVVIAVLKGSFIFVADLVRAMKSPVRIEMLGVSSYGESTRSSGVVRITHDLGAVIEGEHVLVVEDIVDTGLTMAYLLETLRARKPRTLRLASLLHKPSRTEAVVPIDYLGFTIDDVFVVGYGLDHAGEYRNLPYLAVIEEKQ
jgi:hypoxanthine phosphoribosyltransferase